MTMYVKEWIVRKNLNEQEAYAVSEILFEGDVIRETEKAYYLLFDTNYGHIKMWAPKSQCYDEEARREMEREEEKRFEEGCKRYEKLLSFCKENGLKVRKGMRKATLLKKVEEAGLNFEY